MSEKPPAGWYPDNTGTTRWWDGDQWTEHQPPPPPTAASPTATTTATAPSAAAAESATQSQAPARTRADAKAEKAYAKASRPWFKKKRFIIPIALIAVVIVGSALSSGTTPTATDSTPSVSSDAGTQDEAAPEEESEPDMTAGQRNALRSAENYLSVAPFSRKGLIRQLSSDAGDGYSKKDATFAADNVEVDWKEQAAKAAQNYLDISGFSRDGLIRQLTSDAGDGYTRKQAVYGVDQAGL